jgi:hypothetical protein
MTKDQLLKELAKRLREDGPNANIDDLINMTGDNLDNSRQTRDLLDQYTGSEMMKNTSTPIKLGSDKEMTGTMNRLTEEYSDIKNPNWKMIDDPKAYGYFNPNDKTLEASRNFVKNKDGIYTTGGLLAHEPVHQMVNETGGKSVPDNVLSKLKKEMMKENNVMGGIDLSKRGAMLGHEITQAGHLNPNSKMTSSLKNALAAATGKFGKLSKSIPFVGPAIAGGLTMMTTGDAEAAQASAMPILGEADSLGPEAGSPESDIENPSKSYEQRRKAIEQLSQRRD